VYIFGVLRGASYGFYKISFTYQKKKSSNGTIPLLITRQSWEQDECESLV
jgi:hypothetical protein